MGTPGFPIQSFCPARSGRPDLTVRGRPEVPNLDPRPCGLLDLSAQFGYRRQSYSAKCPYLNFTSMGDWTPVWNPFPARRCAALAFVNRIT